MMKENYNSNSPMLSLYDYMGRAAGPELGLKVARAASAAGEKVGTREISNPKFKGKVYLYRKEFLDKYFNNQLITKI